MEIYDLAAESLRRAIELQPDFVEPLQNLGAVLMETGQVEDAVACFDRVLALQPDHFTAGGRRRFALHFHAGYDSDKLLEEIKGWVQTFSAPPKQHVRPNRDERLSQRQLRIGYVSPDFRDHVVGLNVLPIFEHHDHSAFHITCYFNAEQEDEFTDRFRKYADQWRPIAKLGDEEVTRLIIDDQIDILVDLALHTAGNRLPVFARKPAPIQVTFAGYPGTTGLSAIDYRLTDPYLDPPGSKDEFYSEQSIRLPHSIWCYAGMPTAPEVNPLPALQNSQITFGCLNNLLKISNVTWQLWSQVLHVVKDSHFLLRFPAGDHRRWFPEKLDIAADPSGICQRYHDRNTCKPINGSTSDWIAFLTTATPPAWIRFGWACQ